MIDASLTVTANAPATAAPPPSTAQPGFFHDLMSELNPLQYVPVIGTIYRAVTGDTIPETARFAGSLVVSGLMGGPVGIGLNVGTMMLEHMLGIDQEAIGDEILGALGVGPDTKPATATAESGSPSTMGKAPVVPASTATTTMPTARDVVAAAAAATGGWSPAQLAAYGVGQTSRGVLTRGGDTGADVLNGLELARIAPANLPG